MIGNGQPSGRDVLSRPEARLNVIETRQREHSRKPDELYPVIEACSPGPYFELFARGTRPKWTTFGNQSDAYQITWDTYSHHSQAGRELSTVPAK